MKASMTMKKRTRTTTSNTDGREQLLPFRDLTDKVFRIEYDKYNPVVIITEENFDWALQQNPSFIFRIFSQSNQIKPIKCSVPVFDWVTLHGAETAARYICQKLKETCMISNYLLVYTGADYARTTCTRIRINS